MASPARYTVELTTQAARQLRKLPREAQARIVAKLVELEDDPRPHGVKALHGQPGALRLRVGDYRVLYRVTDEMLEVLVVRVAHRREIYER